MQTDSPQLPSLNSFWRNTVAAIIGGVIVLLLSGCLANPTWILTAERSGLTQTTIKGTRFQHLILRNSIPADDGRLHVYIEGDGTPWAHRDKVSADPTPRNPVLLRMMTQDKTAAVYVGRPCYFGLARECSPLDWTHGRYSEDVVLSMLGAIESFVTKNDIKDVTLIGHSGGGTLAVLLAPRLGEVKTVVTLAGNLDIAAWTELHGYSPLEGSLNPADQPKLPGSIRQLHYLGGQDTRIPVAMNRDFFEHNPTAKRFVVEDFGHICCWEGRWPAILESL